MVNKTSSLNKQRGDLMRHKKEKNLLENLLSEERSLTLLDLLFLVLISLGIGVGLFLISNTLGYILLAFGIVAMIYKVLPYLVTSKG